MKLDSMRKLYEGELKDLHSMERQIIKALPKMIRAASNKELKAGLAEHLEVTKEQLERLNEIFARFGKRGQGKKCKGMEGVLEEGSELLAEDALPEVLDAGIIAAAQHVEHYEMAGYGTVVAYARLLGDRAAEKLLAKSLDEERQADQKLTKLAESTVNLDAASA
jgi:ferritin-like metal-binding protein YciE